MIDEVTAACVDAGYPAPQTTGEVMQTIYNSLPTITAAPCRRCKR